MTEDEFAQVYNENAPHVLRWANFYLRNWQDAQDVTQAVFLQAWQRRKSYDPARGTMRAWLLIRARSRALDHLRVRRAHATKERLLEAPPAVTPRESAFAVREALVKIADRHRTRLELRLLGYSDAEAAVLLGEPMGTYKTRARHARRVLRGILES